MTVDVEVIENKKAKPDYDFDGRMIIGGKVSPLCSVRIWLPIDCHEDCRIEVSGSANPPDSHLPTLPCDGLSGPNRLVSEIDSRYGLKIEASGVSVSEVETRPGLLVNGMSVSIASIGRLVVSKCIRGTPKKEEVREEFCQYIAFFLSDLTYGMPRATPMTDFHGNRDAGVVRVKKFEVHSSFGVMEFTLERHWRWVEASYGRVIAGSTPVLVLQNTGAVGSNGSDRVEQLGKDVSMFLTLAARHLIAVHKMTTSSETCITEEWFYPLNRQRSTTREKACGPLVDERKLEEFIVRVSMRWSTLTELQRDAVKLAIYSVNPFVPASSEGHFLRLFSAFEGLATAWSPNLWKIEAKFNALMGKFPLANGALWPIISGTRDSLRDPLHESYSRELVACRPLKAPEKSKKSVRDSCHLRQIGTVLNSVCEA